MSYTIFYRSMFVKLSDGRYIPMMEMGDNNVYDASWGRGKARRSRSWSNLTLNKRQKFFTKEEIVDYLNKWNEECEKQREDYRNSEDEWKKNHADNAFGYFQAIAVYGKGGTWGTKFNDVKNIVLSGIKNAISVEEAVKNCGFKIMYWQSGENLSYFDRQQYVKFETEEEMFKIIEDKFGESGFYFVFNENSGTDKFIKRKKALDGFGKLSTKGKKYYVKVRDNMRNEFYVHLEGNELSLSTSVQQATRFNKQICSKYTMSDLVYAEFPNIWSTHYEYEK